MVLSGDLSDFSLADVLQLLSQQKKTGALELVDGKQTASLYLSQGNITGVRIGHQTPDSKIQDMLLENKSIDDTELSELQAVSREMNRPLSSTLVSKGHLSSAQCDQWLAMAAEDLVGELFTWQKGRYEFSSGNKYQDATLSSITIPTDMACMEGMRRLDEWPRLKESIPDPKVVFRKVGDDYRNYDLGPERMLLDAIDGRRSLEQLQKVVPFGPFRIYDSILNFWHEGFVEPLAVSSAPSERLQLPTSSPQSEKDRQTALLLGVASLVFILALVGRVLLTTTIEQGSALSEGYASGIESRMKRENLETFLTQELVERRELPATLGTLVQSGALDKRELENTQGKRFRYSKLNESEYSLE